MLVGQYIYDLPLNVFADAETEVPETVTIEYLYANLCGDSILREATLIIQDFEQTVLDFESPVGICQGEASLEVNPISGYGPYSYAWSTGPNDTLALNVLTTNTPGFADVTVTDVCGNEVEATVAYTQPPELNDYIDQLNDPLCAGDTVDLQAGINTGVGPFDYAWSTGGNSQTEFVNLNASETVILTVVDPCETESTTEWEVEIHI